MNATKQTRKPKQGDYILEALRQHFLGGDSYIMSDELYGLCKAEYRNLNYDSFQRDVAFLMREGKLHREGRRLYISGTWELEEDAAMRLAELCADNDLIAPHALSKAMLSEQKWSDLLLQKEKRSGLASADTRGLPSDSRFRSDPSLDPSSVRQEEADRESKERLKRFGKSFCSKTESCSAQSRTGADGWKARKTV